MGPALQEPLILSLSKSLVTTLQLHLLHPRYTTSMHWSLTQFTPASMSNLVGPDLGMVIQALWVALVFLVVFRTEHLVGALLVQYQGKCTIFHTLENCATHCCLGNPLVFKIHVRTFLRNVLQTSFTWLLPRIPIRCGPCVRGPGQSKVGVTNTIFITSNCHSLEAFNRQIQWREVSPLACFFLLCWCSPLSSPA